MFIHETFDNGGKVVRKVEETISNDVSYFKEYNENGVLVREWQQEIQPPDPTTEEILLVALTEIANLRAEIEALKGV